MIKQIKDTARAGVTLVELLVVILIVAILAVTMLPMFKKYVVQAQYAAEPIPLVGHIRTQIGLYQYEHNKLPFDASSGKEVLTFKKNTTSGNFDPQTFNVAVAAGPTAPSLTAASTETALSKMDMSVNELIGKRVTPDQVQFACTKNDAGYVYAIGFFGKGNEGLPLNTGYAVLEAYFPKCKVSETSITTGTGTGNTTTQAENGYKLVATWKNYTGDGATSTSGIRFSTNGGDSNCRILAATAVANTVVTVAGNGPTAVENWAGQLNTGANNVTCGRWELPAFK